MLPTDLNHSEWTCQQAAHQSNADSCRAVPARPCEVGVHAGTTSLPVVLFMLVFTFAAILRQRVVRQQRTRLLQLPPAVHACDHCTAAYEHVSMGVKISVPGDHIRLHSSTLVNRTCDLLK